jgi:hypothetical protein
MKRKYHLDDLGVNGKIILKWIIRKQGGRTWIGLIWVRIWTDDGVL